MGILCLQKIFTIFTDEILIAWTENNIIQNETSQILTNLEESIICKLNDKICYTNLKGDRIVKYARALHLHLYEPIFEENEITDKMVIQQKIFHVYDDRKLDKTIEDSNDVPLGLEDLFNMDVSFLE